MKKVYARFKDNIWAADLAEIKPFLSKNKNIKYLLCAIDVFTKYAWVKSIKNNDILMYSTHNEGKSVIAERFIKTIKAKF